MNYLRVMESNLNYLLCVCSFGCTYVGYSQQDPTNIEKIIKFEEALQLGIENNNQLKLATTDVEIANENISQAKTAKWPQFGINAGYTYIGNPKLYEGFYEKSITVDYYEHQAFASIVSSLPLYNGGAINARIDQQKLIGQMQESVLKMTEADVKNTITEQYFTLEKLYRQIEVTKQNIINTELRIKELKSRVENGQNLKSDLLRTELQQSNFKVSVFRKTNTIELISNYLDVLIGLPTNTILKPEVAEIGIPVENVDYQTSLEEAFKNREEIKRAETAIKLAESDLRLTRSGFKPGINANLILNTQYPAQWPNYVNLLNYWAAGISLNWDVSSFYTLKHRVNSDKLYIDKSNTALEMAKDQVEIDVKDAYIRFIESKEIIKRYQKDVELSQSNYKIVKSRYDNDFALISDMVDAELQLNDSKISLVNANVDLLIEYYSLQYAMGKL